MADEGAPSVVEQAPVLAPPAEAKVADDDGFFDLDAGEIDGGKSDEKPEEKAPEPEGAEETANPDEATEDEPEPDEGADESEVAEKPKKPSGSARLKAQLAEAQAEIARLSKAVPKVDDAKELANAVERELGPAPKEEDFGGDYLKFSKAETAYETAALIVARDLKKAGEAAKQQQALHEAAVIETFKERAGEARKSIKDFDATVNSATVSPSHPDTVMLILDSERGPEIAYYLAKNPDKVHELNAMTPTRAAREIGRLEATLVRAKPKTETKAPAIVPKIPSGSPLKEPDPEKMSWEDFDKWFENRQKGRR